MSENKPLKLTEVVGSKRRVKLFAKITDNKTLYYKNPYVTDAEPEVLPQYKTEAGSRVYDLPEPYAQRLLAAEDYKYFLLSPDTLEVPMPISGGGTYNKLFMKKVEKIVDGLVVKEKNGLPVLVSPEDNSPLK